MRRVALAYRPRSDRGFTLIELLVAMLLGLVALALVGGGATFYRSLYSTDIVRTRINGNLRSGMDIIAMNIRQAGENLLSTFPAVTLSGGGGGGASVLTLRRGLVPEVLMLCANEASGSTSLAVSSAGLSNSECVAANVAPLFDVFDGLRTEAGGTMRIYLYDTTQKLGEFVDFQGGSINGGQYFLNIASTSRAYNRLTTSIYVIEEYRFSLDEENDQLLLVLDGEIETPRPVAFDVIDFQVELTMEDNSTLLTLNPDSVLDWKDIRQIAVTLSGESAYKGHSMTSAITAEYFPRNVLSYEG